uniref:FH2 domain containing 3 n=2 Tax=Kryptolebias marmoratus TaxID=37003 RepID=A0A3Q2ZR36_KRYMA
MKKLNWDTIPSHHVVGKLNVWTSQRPQRDLVLDIRTMEELFSHIDKRASIRGSRGVGVRKSNSVELSAQEAQATILDSKRSMNVGIFLRHFKRPVTQIIEDIHQGNWLRFETGKLKELCKLLPEESELKQLLSFRGNLSALPEADQFMVKLVKVPGYEEQLKAMVLREEFFPLMEEVKNAITVMTKAANELLDCDDLHSVIRLVLKAGNYMNAGGYSANAIGFRMTSLLKLADTKANKPGMNLMHYVAKQAEEIDKELLMFPNQLYHIGKASRICKDDIIADFELEVQRIKEVKSFGSTHPGLFRQIEQFLKRAEAKLACVETSLQELNDLSCAVAEYFCEDPAAFKLEECCSIFHSFCKRFDTAVRENREREAAEQKIKQKESMRIAAKRRSTASFSGPEPNDDPSCLESALHNLLSKAPDSLVRSKKNLQPSAEGSLSEYDSDKAVATTPCTSRGSPEKKHPKLREEDEQMEKMESKEVEKMRKITWKVLQYQNGKNFRGGDSVSSSPCSEQENSRTPSTPRSRDYFFSSDGKLGSPWTILSPVAHSRKNRQPGSCRTSSTSSEEYAYDGVWETDENSSLFNACSRESPSPSAGSASLPECLRQRALSQHPLLRSASVDETSQSPAAGFHLGCLFQRSESQRSNSSSSRTASMKEEGTRGGMGGRADGRFLSFFKRIGGRSKQGDLEEHSFRGSDT